MMLSRRVMLGLAVLAPFVRPALAPGWPAIEAEARGQTVYFNAWAGSESINAYIAWVGGIIESRHGVKLVQVKLEDTATAVAKVVAEKAAGKTEGGTVDLIWINGENFASMKSQGLLLSAPWAEKLPNWKYVDAEGKPTVRTDFTIPVDGLEAPWGMAKLVFFHDSAKTKAEDLPISAADLLAWAEKNPGRFSYPMPPDFLGSSFGGIRIHDRVIHRLADGRRLLVLHGDQFDVFFLCCAWRQFQDRNVSPAIGNHKRLIIDEAEPMWRVQTR